MGDLHWFRAPSGADLLIEEGTAQYEAVTSQAGFVEIDKDGGDPIASKADGGASAAPEITVVRVTTDGAIFAVEALAADGSLVQTKTYKTEKGAQNAAGRAAAKLGLEVTEAPASDEG